MAFTEKEITEIMQALQTGQRLRRQLLERLERGERLGHSQAAGVGDVSGVTSLWSQLPPSMKPILKTNLYWNVFSYWAGLGAFGVIGTILVLGLILWLFGLLMGTAKDAGHMIGLIISCVFILGIPLGLIVVGPAFGAWKTYQYWKRDRAWRRTVTKQGR